MQTLASQLGQGREAVRDNTWRIVIGVTCYTCGPWPRGGADLLRFMKIPQILSVYLTMSSHIVFVVFLPFNLEKVRNFHIAFTVNFQLDISDDILNTIVVQNITFWIFFHNLKKPVFLSLVKESFVDVCAIDNIFRRHFPHALLHFRC